MEYYLTRLVDYSYAEALPRVVEALKAEGFGILTEIDAQATIKNKLGIDWRPYKILGACNPQFAHRALTLEDKLGVLLPCSVVVQEHAGGQVEVSAMNPGMIADATGNPALGELGATLTERMQRMLDAL
jgi:uncharacterized protein (DUF302 family)